jgi:predicted nucleic acid-binding protein
VILVDTSVWIELLNGNLSKRLPPGDLIRFVTCGPIVQEVLQGLHDEPLSYPFREAFLALPILSDPLPLHLFMEAGEIYRQGRRKGYTIRSSVDCLIAATAIHNKVRVWHRDRDFDAIARFTSLEVLSGPPQRAKS